MAAPKRRSWNVGEVGRADAVRVVSQAGTLGPSRRRRPKAAPGLGECLAYPVTDGPGVGLLVFLPPVLFFLSLPVFDVIAMVDPLGRGNWALGLLALPIFLPLLVSFALVFGYALLFLGQMFVASALGEPEHPRWPEWDSHQISEGLGRWVWAGVFGLALGGLPALAYWIFCGDLDWFDRVVFADLVIAGVGYALMALAASLLHDSLLAANPFTVVPSIARVGWDYVMPCVAGGVAVALAAAAAWGVFHLPSMRLSVLALWAFWVFFFYETMVVLRMVGLTYHAHADDLGWFRDRPRWGTPSRFGRIYSNS